MPSFRALLAKWFAAKDEHGRAILHIGSKEQLEYYITHPDRVPSGDLLIRSRVPLGKDYQRLWDAMRSTHPVGTSIGIDAPAPVQVQEDMVAQARAALDNDLKSAANRPTGVLKAMRHRANCADDDGYMLIPFFAGEAGLGRDLFKAIDIHQHGPCPLQRWLRQELSAFTPVVQRHFGWTESQLQDQVKLECIGGEIGIEPDLCMSDDQSGTFQILIGHVFYHVMLVAARSCAARVRLSADEPRNAITAKEINDSLRNVIALYDGSDAAPTADAIAAQLLPHQLLIVDRLAKGLRRFVIGHELGHILLWRTNGKFTGFAMPWHSLEEMGRIVKAPPHRLQQWADELACDLIAIKLMQETSLAEAGAEGPFDPRSHLPLLWDFAAIRLWFILWDHILHRMKLAGKSISNTHPLPGVRIIFPEVAYPMWAQEFGKGLSDSFNQRMANI